MYDDYEPLKQPSLLEKIVILIVAVLSFIFWRKNGK